MDKFQMYLFIGLVNCLTHTRPCCEKYFIHACVKIFNNAYVQIFDNRYCDNRFTAYPFFSSITRNFFKINLCIAITITLRNVNVMHVILRSKLSIHLHVSPRIIIFNPKDKDDFIIFTIYK